MEQRTYHGQDVVRFRRTADEYGGLSNMAPGFPIDFAGRRIRTSEALYQACRFPHLPHLQQQIVEERSPMTAKMRSKPYRSNSRPDWDDVRVRIMKWCLRAKLIRNWDRFSRLLLSTGDRPIVEDSRADDFWGAVRQDDDVFVGQNVLGRLLMDLRTRLHEEPVQLLDLAPLPIPDFTLLHQGIPILSIEDPPLGTPDQPNRGRDAQPAFI